MKILQRDRVQAKLLNPPHLLKLSIDVIQLRNVHVLPSALAEAEIQTQREERERENSLSIIKNSRKKQTTTSHKIITTNKLFSRNSK